MEEEYEEFGSDGRIGNEENAVANEEDEDEAYNAIEDESVTEGEEETAVVGFGTTLVDLWRKRNEAMQHAYSIAGSVRDGSSMVAWCCQSQYSVTSASLGWSHGQIVAPSERLDRMHSSFVSVMGTVDINWYGSSSSSTLLDSSTVLSSW
jgi:hypothetical protein